MGQVVLGMGQIWIICPLMIDLIMLIGITNGINELSWLVGIEADVIDPIKFIDFTLSQEVWLSFKTTQSEQEQK